MEKILATDGTLQLSVETQKKVEVSVVIPCLNEANSLAYCVDKAVTAFRNAGLSGEVVVADNGSTDGSIEIAEKLGARVIRVEQRGYGSALRAGISAARGAFIIMGDADDSYDFADVPLFVEKLREGYDVVMGNRFRGGIKPGAMPKLHKYFGNPGLTALLNLFFHVGIGDSYCGMRGFTRSLYDKLDVRSSGMEFALEMIIKSAQIGARITEIPIVLWPDKRGRPPHLRSFRDGWRSLRFMLLYAPNWLFLLPGALLMLFGLAIVFWLLPGPRPIGHGVILDIHTMIFGVIFTLLGAQIVSIGAFAKVFSYAERFDHHSFSLKRILKSVTLESRGKSVFGRICRMRLGDLAVGFRRFRRNAPNPPRSFLVHVAFPGTANYLLFVLPQHAGHQPRHLYRRLRFEVSVGPNQL
jgi:glycosyltransferase involved in cell wall biosynthesis